jgi:hypothetical protein
MEFKDGVFMSAEEKRAVLRDWEIFLQRLTERTDSMPVQEERLMKAFTGRLYKHLHLHCSFIAHYNREGFFDTYFTNPENTLRFLGQFDKDSGCRAIECGGSWWLSGDCADINQAMCEALEPVKAELYAKLQKEAKQRAIQTATALLAKHGVMLTVQQ